jgi:hypothetical protein
MTALFTCTMLACSDGDSHMDTGADAADAGGDAAVVDAAQEVDAQDAAAVPDADAALGPDDPGWTRLPGFPDSCIVELARQPAAVLRFHWEPCADALPACEMAIVDRATIPFGCSSRSA